MLFLKDKYWSLHTYCYLFYCIRARYRSLYIVRTSALVFSLGFSIVITGVSIFFSGYRKISKQNNQPVQGFVWYHQRLCKVNIEPYNLLIGVCHYKQGKYDRSWIIFVGLNIFILFIGVLPYLRRLTQMQVREYQSKRWRLAQRWSSLRS